METTLRMKLSTKTLTGDATGLVFSTDYQDNRNQEWARHTPVAQINITVTNEIGERFELGKAYTFTVSETDDDS